MSPIIDQEHLNSLKEIQGDNELVKELMELFFDQAPKEVKSMNQALNEHNFDTLSKLAHSFKSSSGNVGATHLSQASYAIEKAIRIENLNDFEKLKHLFDQLIIQYDQAFFELKKIYEALD